MVSSPKKLIAGLVKSWATCQDRGAFGQLCCMSNMGLTFRKRVHYSKASDDKLTSILLYVCVGVQ